MPSLKLFTLTLTIATASASLIPAPYVGDASSPNPDHFLPKRQESISCDGNALCSSRPNFGKTCDDAINSLRRGTNYYMYAADTPDVMTGQCAVFDSFNVGCGIFLSGGPDCKGSGDDLWWGAQQIRGSRCEVCGIKNFIGEAGSQCQLKIDYVTGCTPDRG